MKQITLLCSLLIFNLSNLTAQSLNYQAITIGVRPCFGITVANQEIRDYAQIILHSGYNNWMMLPDGGIVLKDNPEYGLTVKDQEISNGTKIILHKGYNLWKVLSNGAIVLKDNPSFGLTILNQQIEDGTSIILHEGYNTWSTRRGMPCELSDTEKKRKWGTFKLTYRINGAPKNFVNSGPTFESLIDDAFQEWQRNSPFTFEKTTDKPANIEVYFAREGTSAFPKGDCLLGRGLGTTKNDAHLFVRGTVFLDDNKTWSNTTVKIGEKVDGTFNLKCVTLHEIGHVLGLQHVSDLNSLMYPDYSNIQIIDQNTKDNINYLYSE